MSADTGAFDRLSAKSAYLAQATIGFNTFPLGTGNSGQILTSNGSGSLTWTSPVGTGSVTSVAVAAPSTIFNVTGGPITSSGTISLAYNSNILPTANGGTGTAAATGTGSNVLSTNPIFIGDLSTPAIVGSGLENDLSVFSSRDLIINGVRDVVIAATGSIRMGGNLYPLTTGTNGQVLTTNGAGVVSWAAGGGGGGSGTVTSVAMTVPSFLTVSPSTITTNGTFAVGYSATPLPIANGGTGASSATGTGAAVLQNSPVFAAKISVPLIEGTGISGDFSLTGRDMTIAASRHLVLNTNDIINGSVRLAGTLYPTIYGTNGHVLTTNGAGVASWRSAFSSLYGASSCTLDSSTCPSENEIGVYVTQLTTRGSLTLTNIGGGFQNNTGRACFVTMYFSIASSTASPAIGPLIESYYIEINGGLRQYYNQPVSLRVRETQSLTFELASGQTVSLRYSNPTVNDRDCGGASQDRLNYTALFF